MRTVTVPISTLNAGRKTVTCTWTVGRLDRSALKRDPMAAGLPGKELKVLGYGLIEHQCGDLVARKAVKPARKLAVKLAPMSRGSVLLVVDVPDPPTATPDRAAILSVREQQRGRAAGGVVVVVTSGGASRLVFPATDLAPVPVPLAVVEGPFMSRDPIYPGAGGGSAVGPAFGPGCLGVLVRNRGTVPLKSLVFYPECMSLVGADWRPQVFEMDALDPGDVFYAAIPFDASGVWPGTGGLIRYVAYADGFDRTRIDVALGGDRDRR